MDNDRATVRSVDRALDILLCFTETKNLTLTEISKKVNLHKSTVFRLLASLEQKEFLVRNPETDKYSLGHRIWELSASINQGEDPLLNMRAEMERIRDLFEETVSLYVRDGRERIRIQAVQSKQVVRRYAPIGARLPLSVGASSKVLVAFASEEDQVFILNDPVWPDNIDKQNYREQLSTIRQKLYATSIEEREVGVSAIAAPILNRDGTIFGALAISGPVNRLTSTRMEEIAPHLVQTAQLMSTMIR